MSRVRRQLGALVIGSLLVAGCAKEQSATDLLREDVAIVVEALNAKDVAAARRALDVLKTDVDAAERLGTVSAAEAGALRTTVEKLRGDLVLLAPVVKPSPTPVPTVPRPTTKGDDEEPGKGKGRGGKDDD